MFFTCLCMTNQSKTLLKNKYTKLTYGSLTLMCFRTKELTFTGSLTARDYLTCYIYFPSHVL